MKYFRPTCDRSGYILRSGAFLGKVSIIPSQNVTILVVLGHRIDILYHFDAVLVYYNTYLREISASCQWP